MLLTQRINILSMIFEGLQSTNSLNEKRDMANCVPGELKDDFNFCLEVLTGMHKLGYKYYHTNEKPEARSTFEGFSIRSLYEFLQTPLMNNDLSDNNIHLYVVQTQHYADFLEPLCNRTIKLGINKSLLGTTSISPMLAKKFEGTLPRSSIYTITEKLDGNRCIAYYDDQQQQWQFMSRNGKRMNVEFSMTGFYKNAIYDGEILSREQVELSNDIYNYIQTGVRPKKAEQLSLFNTTSGIINRKTLNKSLIYNIFDIIDENMPYAKRRDLLDLHVNRAEDVRILPPLLQTAGRLTLEEVIPEILGQVTELGGEGIMINLAEPTYEHKRTNSLLKYKEVQTIDMFVNSIEMGQGKYEGQVGALNCNAMTRDGKQIFCKVGSGLSDAQRDRWSTFEDEIVGKIVEVEYFSISQAQGSPYYSLRFPRLKKVRTDKDTTSTD